MCRMGGKQEVRLARRTGESYKISPTDAVILRDFEVDRAIDKRVVGGGYVCTICHRTQPVLCRR